MIAQHPSPHRGRLPVALAIKLATLAASAHALPAPPYLAVPNFQACMQTSAAGTSTSWCLPKKKPRLCPAASWKKLSALAPSERPPSCGAGR